MTFDLNRLARVSLANLPTPLQDATRLRAELGGPAKAPRILIKRDDLTGLAFGGNKVRKLEFLVADALAKGATTLITAGAAQSNHARATAAAAVMVGLESILVLETDYPDQAPQGNLLLDHLLNAEVRLVPMGGQLTPGMEAAAADVTARGGVPYVIPVGGSNAIGAAGYLTMTIELMAQLAELKAAPEYLYFSNGSRGTQAGIALGAKLLDMPYEVRGVVVSGHTPERTARSVEIANEASELVGSDVRLAAEDMNNLVGYVGEGYAIPTSAADAAIPLLARTEAVFLDPVYTGKGMSGLLDHIATGEIRPDQTVVFVHTGGNPSLFVHAERLMGILRGEMSQPRRRPIYALLVANCVSLIGSSITVVAIPWFVLETTGSAGKAGLSGAVAFLPSFLAGIFGGAVIDRVGARNSAIAADLVSGCSILMVPVLYHTVGLEFWQLLLLILISSMLDIPGVTARRSMLPELAEMGHIRLERVNSILEGNNTISMFIGPPIAGILIGLLGASNVLWIDAGTSLFSALILLFAIPRDLHTRIAAVSQGYVRDLKDGLTFLWKDPVIRAISVALSFTNLFGAPFFSLMFAVYAKERFDDPRYLGFMLSAFSIGMIVGTTFYGWVGFRFSRQTITVLFLLTITVPYWPLATSLPFAVVLGIMVIGGLFDGPVNPLLVTVRLERIPVELRGRVFASTSAIAQLFPPISIPLAGLMIEQWGLTTTVIVFASGAQLVTLILAVNPVWKRLDETMPKSTSVSS